MTKAQEIADIMMQDMFAPHELPVDAELAAKYLNLANKVLAALPQSSVGTPQEIQERAANAIRTFCRSLSPSAVRMSYGTERIYYAGISLDALSVAVALALSDTRPLRNTQGK